MIVLVLQVFVSLMLVAGSLVLFVHAVRSRTLEHADRLALSPLEDDGADPLTEPPTSMAAAPASAVAAEARET